jgi:adenine-specific DNA-methyltransferase
MKGESLNILQDRLEKLKSDFPEIFTEGKIDIEKFKATFNDEINFNNERYVLNWAGKSDAFKVLQIPTTATLKPQPEESVNFDTTENIFIEGENLEVLKVLQKSYYGKVKCIIIDPPYNTGSDSFIYPDSFKENKEEYQKRIGEKDEEGYLMKEGMFRKNSKDSGHYHSNWLSMMYPRLFLARNLLREDGVIFVHIDDNEVHNLRMIMNEIFGEENFVASFIWEKRTNRENRKVVSVRHDYILCYSKLKLDSGRPISQTPMTEKALSNYKNPDNDPRGLWKSDPATAQAGHGTESQFYELIAPNGKTHQLESGRCWLYTKSVMEEAIKDNRIWFGKDGNGVPRVKTYLDAKERGLTPETVLFAKDVGTTESAKNYIKELFHGIAVFETPKSVGLINSLLQMGAADGIILDFFAGSGSTAQAVLELNKNDGGNRKFILVQLPELCDQTSEANKAGFMTIAEISKERIRRVIKKMEAEQVEEEKKKLEQINFGDSDVSMALDQGFKSFKLTNSNFKIWRGTEINEENLVQQLDAFTNPVREGSEKDNMLYELMLKAGYLLTDKVEKIENFYNIKNGELLIAIENISHATVDKMIASKPQKIITLDILFKDNDQLKTNTVLQMKDAGIDFKTI